MGVQSIIYGYIEEATTGVACKEPHASMEMKVHNESVIENLPEVDDWPPMPRSIFSTPAIGALGVTYRSRLIHFAASIKQVDFGFKDWITKFEALLRNMYWESAQVDLQSAYVGDYIFHWNPSRECLDNINRGVLKPVSSWSRYTNIDIDDFNQFTEQP